jgi:hypothetical protein
MNDKQNTMTRLVGILCEVEQFLSTRGARLEISPTVIEENEWGMLRARVGIALKEPEKEEN